MIEFHRVMGNNQLVFWRLSSSIRFSDFHNGDLLFFLAKGTERSKKNREKGIIGYGRLSKSEVLTPRLAWRRYKTMNGYNSEEEFNEVLIKASKNKQMPEQISCLHLENVVFFQAPIYLSELGMEISNNVESYVYLDKEENTTLQILEKAKEVGIDIWSLTLSDEVQEEAFEKAQQIEIISRICEFLKDKDDSKEKSLNRFMLRAISQIENEYSDIDFIKGSVCEAYQISGNTVSIFVPLVYTSRTKIEIIQSMIGKLQSYSALLGMDQYIEMKVELYALVDEELEEGLVAWIENCGIHCIKISIN